MFEDEVIGEPGKHPPIFARGLLDHGQEGHGQHDALELVGSRVFQRETQHGERLAGAGRCREREHVRRRRRCFPDCSPKRLAGRQHRGVGLRAGAYPFTHVAIQGIEPGLGVERLPGGAGALVLDVALKMDFGVQKIGIDQTGKQQAHIQHRGDGFSKSALKGYRSGCRRVELKSVGVGTLREPIGIRVAQVQIEWMLHRQFVRRNATQCRRMASLQANVMALDRQRGGNRAMLREGNPGALGPVVKSGVSSCQARLETVGVFPKIMQQAGKRSFVGPACDAGMGFG